MTTEATTPLDVYRANLELALRMLSCGHKARQQACEFAMQRVKRDLTAINTTREAAAGAHDWNDFGESCQVMLRDYIEATTNLWQQGWVSALRQQSAYSDGIREALANWQSTWTDQWKKSIGMNPAAIPMQEWTQHFEQALGGVLEGRAPVAVPPFATLDDSAQGERHVG
ncbi:hypothetical protein [Paraburkholderia elongata]|uniref:Phasin protein n=1 Tax=Paraburkholderia elongata TaxID=2675747 RepID=A0A972NPP0_9BURK|nr:hypothetical protein [Paraburkholderia elongata]NPT56153.1 hypothetical protein [Paraburkholderia elongata]